MLIDHYDYFYDFFEDFDSGFTKELGSIKTNEIANKISNSKTIKNLGENLIKTRRIPNGQTVIEAVMSTRHFLFSKKEVICYASMVSLAQILNEAALREIRFSEEGMLQVAKEILNSIRKI